MECLHHMTGVICAFHAVWHLQLMCAAFTEENIAVYLEQKSHLVLLHG